MNLKSLLWSSAGLLVLILVASVFIQENDRSGSDPTLFSANLPNLGAEGRKSKLPTENLTNDPVASPTSESILQTALKEADPVRRQELLRQWADSIETDQIANLLEQLESSITSERRSEVRQMLLSSWVGRDAAGMGLWFGERYVADEMHQESRDLLIKVLGGMEPSEGVSWMEKNLSPSARHELYGPFFRQWTGKDPAAAAAKLRQLAEASPENPLWNNLIGQVAAQWAEVALYPAVTWIKLLPDGAAKSTALEQVSYHWAKVDPRAAAMYAATQSDPAVLQSVATTWAAREPKSAADWAVGLPVGEGQNRAIATATVVWARNDLTSASDYVNRLPAGEAQNQARIALATMWAETDPPKAANWVEQLPENSAREQALQQVMNSWAATNPKEASRWLERLPETRSRDAALIAFCGATDTAEPALSFELAERISEESVRHQRLEQTATAWLEKDAIGALRSISRSSLPEAIKKQLIESVQSRKR